ncbi:MAG: YceI family protein [Solirubrobacterales bacterium]
MTSATETTAAAGVWTVDKIHSTVRYEIEHNGTATYRGNFGDIDAQLEYGEDGVKITGSVNLDSVDLSDEQQKGHVLSPDFFDAERHPTVDYASTSVELDGAEVIVHGDLTIKGVTKPVTVRGTIGAPGPNLGGTQTVAVSLHTTINRQDYGVSWNTELPNGNKVLGDDVYVSVELELVQG